MCATIHASMRRIVVVMSLCLSPWFVHAVEDDILEDNLRESVEFLAQDQKTRVVGSQGHRESAAWIERQFAKHGLQRLGDSSGSTYVQKFRAWDKDGYNIIGGLGNFGPGTKCVILGAHYDSNKNDSRGCPVPGADDNASGIAGMLEIARVLSSKKNVLKQCVIFAAWDFEEAPEYTTLKGIANYKTLGTNGSRYYSKNPTVSTINKIQFSITFDLIGGDFFAGAEDYFMILGVESHSSVRKQVNASKSTLPANIIGLNFDIRTLEPFHNILFSRDAHAHQRSDYDGFRDNNIPFAFISTGVPWYYHTAFDTIKEIHFPKLKSIAKFTEKLIFDIVSSPTQKINPAREAKPKLSQDNSESALSIKQLLSAIVENKEQNLLDQTLVYEKKSKGKVLSTDVYSGEETYKELKDHLSNITNAIDNEEYYKLNKPINIYHSIFQSLVSATRLKLIQQRISLDNNNQQCPSNQAP